MNDRFICFCTLSFLFFSGAACAQTAPAQKSTADEQAAVEVTVYNNNLGLIKDVRRLSLPAGEGELRFMDVASYIKPETVSVRSINLPGDFTVLEQNYEYDLMNEDKLLDKYVGKKVKLISWNEYQDRKETVEGTLLSNNDGQIYEINNEIYLGHPGYKVLPGIPENLIAKPTLTWLFASKTTKPHDIEVSYLTENITWKADYVVVLDKDDKSSDISGWVTIDNQSGAAYKDASLKLIAGEVQRAEEPMRSYARAEKMLSAAEADSGFEEKAFFEYHIYDLHRKTTIKDKQTKQISLLEAAGAKIAKELLTYGQRYYFSGNYGGNKIKQPVNVFIKFKNSKENNLGMPLPEGIMRLYKKDHEESMQFIGENRIGHTPKDEEIKIKIGEAFDIVAERLQTDYRQVSTKLYETEWEITLRNHKQEDVEVGLVESVGSNCKIIKNNHPYEKMDAFNMKFNIKVPKNGEVKVAYRAQVGI